MNATFLAIFFTFICCFLFFFVNATMLACLEIHIPGLHLTEQESYSERSGPRLCGWNEIIELEQGTRWGPLLSSRLTVIQEYSHQAILGTWNGNIGCSVRITDNELSTGDIPQAFLI